MNNTGEPQQNTNGGETAIASVSELRQRVQDHKRNFEFGKARELLSDPKHTALANTKAHSDWIAQQRALCTYKDEELHPSERFTQALTLLDGIELRDPTNRDPETLALGGAIYKRRWEYGGQLDHLYQALAFYRAAHDRNPEEDMGYGGVNAAYLLDLLAARLRAAANRNGTEAKEADALAEQARSLRISMKTSLPQFALMKIPDPRREYWYLVTLAEIHYGLREYDAAERQLREAASLNVGEWEKQTTFKQLISLARLQDAELPREGTKPQDWPPVWRALSAILGDETERALSCFRGKVGLALSGGGFRASFFHLGVLARLAEIDALRGIEVLSTVSGGSIVGAHYYLEVQKLIESKADRDITQQDYIEIVKRVQTDFLAGVQTNIRMNAFDDFRKNAQMLIFPKRYSRSHRLGELYEETLFARVQDGKADADRTMPQLMIKPEDQAAAGAFKPKFSNWRRRARVPALLLNTTSLNTGHNFHFTARFMGEPPGLSGNEVDINERFRRVYYEDIQDQRLRDYRLGHAVAASACVPGLFDPLVISGLYADRTVRLVDGGVHDNQGVAGLLDEGCNLILCSDASGQMRDVRDPSEDPAGVALRASGILQDRVREAQYQDLQARVESRALEGLFFVHTKKELETPPVDWIGCQDPSDYVCPAGNQTSYGVDRDLQAKLASIRTDLDAFTEVEAYALMASGYLMTKREFATLQARHRDEGKPGTWGGYAIDAACGDWRFRKLEPLLGLPKDEGGPEARKDLEKQLSVAASAFFKAWRIVPALKPKLVAILVAAVAAVIALAALFWNFTITGSAIVIGLALLVITFFLPAVKWLFPQEQARSFAIKLAVALGGYLLAKVHLNLIDKLYLERGSLARLLGEAGNPSNSSTK